MAFVERWTELFHPLTIDNFSVKHLNVRVGFDELRKVVEESENKSIEASNIQDVSAELLKILKNDPLAKKILPYQEHYYLSLEKPYLGDQSKAVHPGLKVLVEQACAVLGEKYRSALIDSILITIQKDDIDKTLQLTSLLASDLTHSGYGLNHLYSKGLSFLKKPVRPFNERLHELFEYLKSNALQAFSVAYRMDFANEDDASRCPTSFGSVQIVSQTNADYSLASQIPGPNVRLVKLDLEALDPFAALRKGRIEFHRCLDVLFFTRPSLQIVNHHHAYVVESNQVQRYSTALELLGPIRNAKEDIEYRVSQLIALSQRIDDASLRRLTLGLQSLRRGLTETDPQGQFLNYWIGLEVIAGGKYRTDITTIRKTVSQVMAMGYPRRLIRDLKDNFDRLGIPLAPLVTSEIELETLDELWRSICDESSQEQLIARAATSPLLQSRVKLTASMFGSSGNAREAILAHKQDIDWHLQRLYRVRNAIVHGGDVPSDLTHLASHLATYLWVILRSILNDFSSDEGTRDISKFFDKHIKIYEMVLKCLADTAAADDPRFALLLDPVTIWPK